MSLIYLDFEFHSSNERHPTLVCATFNNKNYWLFDNGEQKAELIRDIKANINETFVAYYSVAEARCIEALGINPLSIKWVDLYAEFRMLQNANNEFEYGNYIDDDGTIKLSVRPIPGRKSEENNKSVPSNLINAAYKLLGIRMDSQYKNTMRDIILSKDPVLIESNRDAIMMYCAEDVKHLPKLFDAIFSKELQLIGVSSAKLRQQILGRGEYSAAMALVEATGLPIDMELLKKIEQATPAILEEGKQEVNTFFPLFVPEYTPPPRIYKNGKKHEYKSIPAHRDTSAYQSYVETLNIDDFPITESGKYKSDKSTLELYPEVPALDAIWRYNHMDSCLKWFKSNNSKGFYQALGSDNSVRPMYSVFGTQTGRNAAKAKTFPLAMSNWLRTIIRAPKGQSLIVCDFSQQEVYIAAKLSQDDNLLEAYNSGDVYLTFGKQAGLIPKDGTKVTYKFERQMCKGTVLGLQFGMGLDKLHRKLCFETSKNLDKSQTEELHKAHKDTYSQYWKWVYKLRKDYQQGSIITVQDGWTMFNDNPSMTSVGNMPVQGTGAAITRLATVDALKAGLKVVANLHDSIYILSSNPEEEQRMLERIMLNATAAIMQEPVNQCTMRIDGKVFTHDDLYIEEKGEKDWNRFKKYLGV